jgi:sec-independent protein translocase protein TatA
MGELSPWHILIVVVVILVLFSSKLPGAAKSIGQSLKIFKDETKGLRDDHSASTVAAQTPVVPAPVAQLPVPPAVVVPPPVTVPAPPIVQAPVTTVPQAAPATPPSA